MADDTIAFFKSWQIGDFLKGPPGIASEIQTAIELQGTVWSEVAIPNEQGPAGSTRITMPACLMSAGCATQEDIALWHRRRAKWSEDTRKAAGTSYGNSIYSMSGWLVWVLNDGTDRAPMTDDMAAVSGPPAPYRYLIEVEAGKLSNIPSTAATGDGYWVFLGDDSSSDVGEVIAVDESTNPGYRQITVEFADFPAAGAYLTAATVCHIVQAWKDAYLVAGADLPGIEPGSNRHEFDVPVVFACLNEAIPAP